MKIHVTCAGLALLVFLLAGCANYNPKYENYYTYAQTRKVVDSPTLPVYKTVFAPIIFIPETLASPVTAYMDSSIHPPESRDGHVYLSYIGLKTMSRAMDDPSAGPIMGVALGLVTLVDTIWFPVAGTMDTIYIMTRDTPEQEFKR